MIGETIAHYKVLEKLGEGGMGVVYLAEDTKLKRPVALKFLPTRLTSDQESLNRFEREAQAAAASNHPNIVTIYEIGEHQGRVYIAMEYVEGHSLRSVMEDRPMPLGQALDLAAQLAEGLRRAHRAGIVHRDLKPENVLVNADGRIKILDFGLAKLRGVSKLTREDSTLGTANYMSPEQAQGLDVDARTDAWSLGVILYEMLTGVRPFRGEYEQAVIYAILNQVPEPLTALRSGLPLELEHVVAKCLSKNRSERYQHVEELGTDIDRIRNTVSSDDNPAVRPAAYRAPGGKRKRGGRIQVWAGIFLVAVIGASVLWKSSRESNPKSTSRPVASMNPAAIEDSRPSVAVLPLDNISGDSEQEYFTDGMTEALIATLAQVGSIKVISRTSVMRYKDVVKPLPEIANELNVRYVLEGSILKADDRVRITAQLISASTDEHLWAKSYDRDLRDILTLQAEVARAIVEEIKVRLTPQEEMRIASVMEVDPACYNLYLLGRFHWNKRDEEGLDKSIEYLREAVEKNPDYALAFSGLADAYLVSADWGFITPQDGISEARELAGRALEIDPNLAEAHASKAYVLYVYDWDWAAAEREFLRAIELNPNYATAHQWYGEFLSSQGRHEEALQEMELARNLDPLSRIVNLMRGLVFYYGRDYRAAIEALEVTLEIDRNFYGAHNTMALVHQATGNYDQMVEWMQSSLTLAEVSPEGVESVGRAYREGGIEGLYRRMIELCDERARDRFVSAVDATFGKAFYHCYLGELDQAMEYLDMAYEQKASRLIIAKVTPRLDGLRDDPRFQSLLDRMGF